MEELIIKIIADAEGVASGCKDAQQEVQNMASEVEGSGSSMKETFAQIASAIASAFSADKIFDFLEACNELNQTQWESEIQFDAIAKNRLKMGDEEIKQWHDKASAIQKATVFGDEATLSMWASAGAILGSSQALETLTPAIADTTSMWYGADASAEQYTQTGQKMAKAVQTGQLRSLQMLGIYLDGDYATAWENATSAEERAKILADFCQVSYGGLSSVIADTAGGAITQMNNAWGDCKEIMGSAIAPIIQVVATALSNLAAYLAEHPALLQAIAIVLGIVAVAMTAYAAATAVAAIANTALLAPILIIIGVIGALIAIITLCITHWDEIKATAIAVWDAVCNAVSSAVSAIGGFFSSMWSSIKSTVSSIVSGVQSKFNTVKSAMVNAISNAKSAVVSAFTTLKSNIDSKISAIKSSVQSKFDAIKSAIVDKISAARDKVKEVIDKIKSFFNFSWDLPPLKLPHFTATGKFSLNPISVPHFSVSWYSKGGVFDNPTLFGNTPNLGVLGEKGAEAIVPLENNTEWLDKIAERLNGNQKQIILQVDGKTFAQTSINSINSLTKQTGKLGLALM